MRSFLCCGLLLVLANVAPAQAGKETERLPLVVLVGDSIRLGYAPFVAEQLKGKAEVISPAENGGDSAHVLAHLDEWVIKRKPAVVHFNAGLHDIKIDRKTGKHQVELDAYRSNLDAIRQELERATSARLIFATTTPVIDARHNLVKPFDRREADVLEYNRVALEVMSASALVTINDLHAAADRLGSNAALGEDGVHFTKEACAELGDEVAGVIEQALREPPVTREAVCRWVRQAPVIDGRLNDPAWARAAVIDRFSAYWSKTDTGYNTRARLVWDEDALYFAATMTDAELRSFGTKRNDHLWEGDVFELFFKPDADKPAYYEFQANPKSLILELAWAKRGDNFDELAAKPPLGMQAVAVVDGTLDHPGDRDRGWTVEGKIPWTAFASTGGRPAPGATWLFALCRYDYGPQGTQPVLMSSAPLTRPSFHRYEDYGKLIFEAPAR